jgi:hypothetical protein
VNPDKLSRQAIRLAQRKSRKAGRPLTREEVLRLRVQTVEPWKRIFVIGVGLFLGALSFLAFRSEAPMWVWGMFAIFSAFSVLCGAFGRKAYLDRELKKLKDAGPTAVLDAIISALI